MDDNISRFTQISIDPNKNTATELESLTLFKGIYGVEENDLLVHFYFKGVESNTIKNFRELLADKSIPFVEEIIEPTNWNKVWENSFSPIMIGKKWLIRAEFHPSRPGFKNEIIISPKMAFGTGHHATTFMVLEQMEELDLNGKKVLDLGCGSGILAVAAEKLGASSILAVDYDPLSVENTIENSQLNNCQKIKVEQANVYSFDTGGFDVVLANINKKVLTDNILKIKGLLNPSGILIISGILSGDEGEIKKILGEKSTIKSYAKDNWSCMILRIY
ncbi:MAG: 50S ribosomal protein L11 methyltransferase [Saprospirales bacterium]|nr:MAG: 50S ribosomal protein L11 methyltransferase [Saprospirales bacterium]